MLYCDTWHTKLRERKERGLFLPHDILKMRGLLWRFIHKGLLDFPDPPNRVDKWVIGL